MIVTPVGLVVFPPDPHFSALTSREGWATIPTVMDHQLVRTLPGNQTIYLFIQSNQPTVDYYAIKEKLTDDIRGKASASSP